MVITVSRQYGSGGREIGTMLAKQLGIAYYDDMLLKEAAEESGLAKSCSVPLMNARSVFSIPSQWIPTPSR